MQKKIVLALLMTALLAGGVFAQGFLSAGGGLAISPSFSTGKYDGKELDDASVGFDAGLNLFFDAKYVEVNLGLLFGNTKSAKDAGGKGIDTTTLTLGLVGKYPFEFGTKFALFPFLGIDYSINLGAKSDGEEIKDEGDFKKADYFNALSILLGIGFDFGLTDSIYLRLEAGYGIVLNTKVQADLVSKDSKYVFSNGKIPAKLAIGFRF